MIREVGIAYKDKDENICRGVLEMVNGINTISILNFQNKIAGELRFIIKDNKAVIEYLYCQQKYRGTGVGKTLIDVFETCVRKKVPEISGIFAPFQEIYDEEIFGYDEDVCINTAKFYSRNGYHILHYKSRTCIDDKLNEENTKPIAIEFLISKETKNIKPRFEFIGDILFDKNLYDIKPKKVKNMV